MITNDTPPAQPVTPEPYVHHCQGGDSQPIDDKLYVGSTGGEIFSSETYDSREAAVLGFPEEYGLDVGDHFSIGVQYTPDVRLPRVDFDRITERLSEEIPFEVLDNGWPKSTAAQEDELNAALNAVFQTWLERHGLQPTFFGVTDITEHQVPEDPA